MIGNNKVIRGVIGGKTGKTLVLPEFCRIELVGGSGGAPPCYRGLIWLGRVHRAGGASGHSKLHIVHNFQNICHWFNILTNRDQSGSGKLVEILRSNFRSTLALHL